MIPVFLLLTALVVDVGDWFTHKRQLQNRADAAAFAAGVEYAKNWKACVQTGERRAEASAPRARSPTRRGSTRATPRRRTTRAARLPATLHNTEIANQSKLDVVINSTIRTTTTTPTTRTAAGTSPNPCFNPCYRNDRRRSLRAAGTGRTSGSRSATSRRSSARVGLPLSRNGARARVEIRPAISGHRLPAARRAEQRDHEGAGALLQRVHAAHADRDAGPRAAPDGRPVGLRRSGRRNAVGRSRDAATRPSATRTVSFEPRAAELRARRCGDYRRRSGSRCGSRAARRRPRTRPAPAAHRRAIRRLLPPALADPRLERRQRRLRQPRLTDVHVTRRLRQLPATRTSARSRSRRPTAGSTSRSRSNWGTRDDREQRRQQLHGERERRRR